MQDQIGSGGMGTVYRALDRELNRVVAIKVLRPELAPDLRNLLRLKRELVLASRVSDEHVVRVYDIGEVNGQALIAMDWVDGESLAQLLGRVHCLPPSQVCAFAVEISLALRAIHAANVVHRDLKPGNLLIRSDGAILVSDFGLARSALPQDPGFTQPGERNGTPRYMAPEQLAGLPADARSDLYSLGIVLLEALTGTTALESLTPLRLRLLIAHTERDKRSGELRKLAALETVIRRCLHPDRTERYAGADAVLQDLWGADAEPAVAPGHAPARRIRSLLRKPKWRNLTVAALLLTLSLLTLGGFYYTRRNAQAEAVRLYSQALAITTRDGSEAGLRRALQTLEQALSYNSRYLAAVRARVETLIRLFEGTDDPQWLAQARDALHSVGASRLNPQERTLFAARIDFLAGSFPNVIQTLQSAPSLLASSGDANLLLGRAWASSGQLTTAVAYYRAAIRLSPESWRSHNDLGSALLALGQPAQARQEFLRVTRLRPDSPIGFANLGSALLETGDLTAARRNFEIALQFAPSPAVYFSLGVAAYYAREFATSIPFFESAIQLRPRADLYVGALADVLRHLHRDDRARDTYARALSMLQQIAQVRPLSPDELCRQAIYLARLGDRIGATSAIDAAAVNHQTLPDVPYARAVLAALQSHPAEANRYLKKAVQLGYPSALVELDPDFDDVY